jgi:PAS domain S-box-containing protein
MLKPGTAEHEGARLGALRRYQILDTSEERSFDGKVRLVAHLFDVPIALFALIDTHRVFFKARYGFDISEVPRETWFCTQLLQTQGPLVVADTTQDERFRDQPQSTGERSLRFYVGVPLLTPDGFVIGTLCALDHQPRPVSAEKIELLTLLAEQLMDELELRRKNLEIAKQAAGYAKERATLYAMLDQAPGAVGLWTPELTNAYANAYYGRLLGRSCQELHGMHAREVLGEAAFERAYPHLLGALSGEGQSFENVWTTPLGEEREVHVEYTPLIDGGRVLGVIVHFLDMTARNQATREFMHIQAKQRALLDALPGVALQLGTDGRIAALYGRDDEYPFFRVEDVRGRSLHELLAELNIGHRIEHFEETMRRAHENQRREIFDFELLVEGEARHYEARVAPASDLVDTVCLLLDVTRRVQAEQTLRGYSARLDAVITSATDGILIFDEPGNILQANPAMEKLCGYSKSELLLGNVAMLAADLLAVKSAAPRDQASTPGTGALLLNEVAISRKDGSQFFAEISVGSFAFAGKLHFSAIVRDIQERKLMRARSEFISMVSHELRAPLNTVVGLGEAMIEDQQEPLPPRQHERMRTILSSAQHLAEVVKDILDLSRIELGMLQLERADIAIGWLCDLACAMVSDAADRREIILRKDVSCGDLTICVDRRRILQILVNLLDNAIKFTAPQGQVFLAVRKTDAVVEFAIHDTGIGIAEGDLQRLFKPFSQVESTMNRKFQGVGLGLYLAQRLAMLHAGHISVRSTPGSGTCFTLSIPRSPVALESASVRMHPDRG